MFLSIDVSPLLSPSLLLSPKKKKEKKSDGDQLRKPLKPEHSGDGRSAWQHMGSGMTSAFTQGASRRGSAKLQSQVSGGSLASPSLLAGGLEQVTSVREAQGLSESPGRANSLRGPGQVAIHSTHSSPAQTLAEWVLGWG